MPLSNSIKLLFAICLLSSVRIPLKAQSSLGLELGLTSPADQFKLPDGHENFGLFIDPRPGFFGAVSFQYDWSEISVYATAGWMYYRTFQGVGPWINASGVGISAPSYFQLERWIGTYTELGLRKTILRHPWANVEGGLGFGHAINIENYHDTYPDHNVGFLEIDRVMYFDNEITWLTPHSFLVTPHIRFWRETKNKNRWWLKVQYSQGLNPIARGSYDVYYLNSDNERTDNFSFDVVLRHSFYKVTFGYALFPGKYKDKSFWYPE